MNKSQPSIQVLWNINTVINTVSFCHLLFPHLFIAQFMSLQVISLSYNEAL